VFYFREHSILKIPVPLYNFKVFSGQSYCYELDSYMANIVKVKKAIIKSSFLHPDNRNRLRFCTMMVSIWGHVYKSSSGQHYAWRI